MTYMPYLSVATLPNISYAKWTPLDCPMGNGKNINSINLILVNIGHTGEFNNLY